MLSRAPPLSHAHPLQTHQQAPVTHETMQQVPLQAAGIEERLQTLGQQSQPVNHVGIATIFSSTPCIYISVK